MLLLLPISLALAGTVDLSGDQYMPLLPPDPERPEDPPGVVVLRRTIELSPQEEDSDLDVTWTLVSSEPTWFDGRLADASLHISHATVDGTRLPITSTRQEHRVTIFVDGTTTLRVKGTVDGTVARGLQLGLLGASTGALTSTLPVDVAASVWVDGAWWGAPEQLIVSPDQQRSASRRDLLSAEVGLGLTVGESDVRVQGRVLVSVLGGSVERITLSASGMGDDLTLTGSVVNKWTRRGNSIDVELTEPVDDLVALDVSWSVLAGDSANVPTLKVDGAFRHEWSLQLARDGDLEVIPDLAGWTSMPSAQLPEWGSGLVLGTPTASYEATANPSGRLSLLEFTPVSGPKTIIDVASYKVATADHGRALIRAHYEVRNDRGAHLHLKAPEGLRLIGVRVAGETTAPAKHTDGGWLIPLQRSVETMEGLLTFPVEVILMGTDQAWERRTEREFPLPTVNAEVAVSRVTLFLPIGYESQIETGESGTVADFSEGEGLTYGFGVGDTRAAEADQLFQDAVSAWMSNEFDEGQEILEELNSLGASNENISRLQSNFDVVSGNYSKDDDKASMATERRVKEQARARAKSEEEVYRKTLQEAEMQALSGDYEAAEQNYQMALEIGGKLEKLEQEESVEISAENKVLKKQLEVVAKESKKRKSSNAKGFGYNAEAQKVYDFEDVDVLGGLIGTDDNGRNDLGDPTGTESGTILFDGTTTIDFAADAIGSGGSAASSYGWGRGEGEGKMGQPDTGVEPAGDRQPALMELKEELLRIPAGRTYQQPLTAAPGVAARDMPMEPEPMPEYDEYDGFDDYDMDTAIVVTRSAPPRASRGRGRLGGVKSRPNAKPPPPPPPMVPAAVPTPSPSPVEEPLEVTAAALSIVVPEKGEAVRYQHLLLPVGADLTVTVHAKTSRRNKP
jgi:hypothetical protein